MRASDKGEGGGDRDTMGVQEVVGIIGLPNSVGVAPGAKELIKVHNLDRTDSKSEILNLSSAISV